MVFDQKRVDQCWTQMYTGIAFELLNPVVRDIYMQDIAQSLSLQCRYCGHVDRFYSVAEHCVFMSHRVSPLAAPYALLHDAAETYTSDLPSPIKRNVTGYKEIEDPIMLVVLAAFNLPEPSKEIEDEVHIADIRMLLTERRDFMKEPPRPWGGDTENHEPYEEKLTGWVDVVAKCEYIKRADELGVQYR